MHSSSRTLIILQCTLPEMQSFTLLSLQFSGSCWWSYCCSCCLNFKLESLVYPKYLFLKERRRKWSSLPDKRITLYLACVWTPAELLILLIYSWHSLQLSCRNKLVSFCSAFRSHSFDSICFSCLFFAFCYSSFSFIFTVSLVWAKFVFASFVSFIWKLHTLHLQCQMQCSRTRTVHSLEESNLRELSSFTNYISFSVVCSFRLLFLLICYFFHFASQVYISFSVALSMNESRQARVTSLRDTSMLLMMTQDLQENELVKNWETC